MKNEIVRKIVNRAKLYTNITEILSIINIIVIGIIGVAGMVMRDELVNSYRTIALLMLNYLLLNVIYAIATEKRRDFRYHSDSIIKRYKNDNEKKFEHPNIELLFTVVGVLGIITGGILFWKLLKTPFWNFKMINSAKIMFFSVIVICIALLKGEKYIEKYFLKQLYIVDAEDPQTKDAKIDLFNMF